MNPSPLRYPGGKYKLYKYVSELVKENKCTTYIEPFCGGAAIALELLFEGIVKDVIINDYDYTIFCFWNSILHETDEFVQLILDTQITMDEWHKQKAVRNELDTHSSLEIGFSTFFLNRTNRSGIIDKAGPIGGLSQQGDYPFLVRSIIEQSIIYYSKKHYIQGQNKLIWEKIKDIGKLSKIIENYKRNLPNYITDTTMRQYFTNLFGNYEDNVDPLNWVVHRPAEFQLDSSTLVELPRKGLLTLINFLLS